LLVWARLIDAMPREESVNTRSRLRDSILILVAATSQILIPDRTHRQPHHGFVSCSARAAKTVASCCIADVVVASPNNSDHCRSCRFPLRSRTRKPSLGAIHPVPFFIPSQSWSKNRVTRMRTDGLYAVSNRDQRTNGSRTWRQPV